MSQWYEHNGCMKTLNEIVRERKNLQTYVDNVLEQFNCALEQDYSMRTTVDYNPLKVDLVCSEYDDNKDIYDEYNSHYYSMAVDIIHMKK